MKLRYMIEYVLRDRIREPHYAPVGVWVAEHVRIAEEWE